MMINQKIHVVTILRDIHIPAALNHLARITEYVGT